MIDGGPRSASVIAIAGCSLLFLSRAKFQTCIDSRPELTSYLVKMLARRLREADDSLAATPGMDTPPTTSNAQQIAPTGNLRAHHGSDRCRGRRQQRQQHREGRACSR
jgi:CRP-like cAMP-binding protein